MEISESTIMEIMNAYEVIKYRLNKKGDNIDNYLQSDIAEMIYEELD